MPFWSKVPSNNVRSLNNKESCQETMYLVKPLRYTCIPMMMRPYLARVIPTLISWGSVRKPRCSLSQLRSGCTRLRFLISPTGWERTVDRITYPYSSPVGEDGERHKLYITKHLITVHERCKETSLSVTETIASSSSWVSAACTRISTSTISG